MLTPSDFIEMDFHQREYDGHWEHIARVMDYDNQYTYKTESGADVTQVPTKWITIGVYPFLMEIV